jgi:type VI protein secretion system component Hcp
MSKLITSVLAVWFLLAGHVAASHAAIDMFLLVPNVPGEANDPAHSGWIQVETATWNHGEAPPGSPVKLQFGRVTIAKRNDSTSPLLALLAASGQPIKDVKLEMLLTGATRPLLLRLKLTNVRVASYATALRSTDNVGSDSIGLSFDTITWINFKVNAQGQSVAGSSACWDVVNNKSCAPAF